MKKTIARTQASDRLQPTQAAVQRKEITIPVDNDFLRWYKKEVAIAKQLAKLE